MVLLEKFKFVSMLTCVIALCASAALANPSGGASTYGNATITQPNASTVQINIPGNKAIINWNSFSIANGELTNFIFANTGGGKFNNAVLNRVTGGTASVIAGQLQANGAVFLVNPNGIIFNGTAQVNSPAFFATTLNISDAQFKAFTPTQTSTDHWSMVFSEVPGTAGNIELQNGAKIITDGQDGMIALMAKNVNVAQGVTLSAPQGTVMLTAAKELTLSQSGSGNNGMFNLAYKTENGNTVTNSGLITILDGTNGLTGQGGGTVSMVGNNVTQNGIIYAATSTNKVSRILLVASNDVNVASGSLTSVDGAGGNRAGYVGAVAGGSVNVENGATINAIGNNNNGGDIIIKGNGVTIGQNAIFNVSKTVNGNPGSVISTVNGGGDVYATVEYSRLAVRPNGDKMILDNDGTENLPPVLPPNIKQQAMNIISSTIKPPPSAPANDFKPAANQNISQPVVVAPINQEKPSSVSSNPQSTPSPASPDSNPQSTLSQTTDGKTDTSSSPTQEKDITNE